MLVDLLPIAKAAYLLDHGWDFEHKQDGNHLYKTPERPFMERGVDLETAYAMQKSQEDQFGKTTIT